MELTGTQTLTILDFNGVNDYVEAGDTVNIITNPSTVNVLLFDDTIFVGSGTSPSIISQRWQQSDDGGETFRSLRNTPSLIITGVLEADRNSQRPKLIEFKAIKRCRLSERLQDKGWI